MGPTSAASGVDQLHGDGLRRGPSATNAMAVEILAFVREERWRLRNKRERGPCRALSTSGDEIPREPDGTAGPGFRRAPRASETAQVRRQNAGALTPPDGTGSQAQSRALSRSARRFRLIGQAVEFTQNPAPHMRARAMWMRLRAEDKDRLLRDSCQG